MKEALEQLLLHARGMWRFRWYALAAAWIIVPLGWAMVVLIPNTYEAQASIYVDTNSLLSPLLNGLAVNTDAESRVSMVAHLILSRTHLEEVARSTGLAARARTPDQFEDLLDGLSKEIEVSANGNIYTLSYSDHDPKIAASVVKNLRDAFIHDTMGMKRTDSGSARQFLQSQIREYESRLQDAEHRLADFKRNNVGLLPGEGVDYFSQLQTESGKVQDLQAKLQIALDQKAELKRQLEGESPTFGLFSSTLGESDTSGEAINRQIAADEDQIEKLELRYTDKYPSVVALKAQIAQLKKRRTEVHAAPRKRNTGIPVPTDASQAAAYQLDLNPVYQDLRVEQSQTEVQIAQLRGELAQESQMVHDLKARVNTMPLVQANLMQLTRNYEVTKKIYDSLLQRLDSANLSEQAAAADDQVKFHVLRPGTPFRSGPNRPLLVTLVLVLGIGFGLGIAFLLNEIRPVFLTRDSLAAVTGLPVLGSVCLTGQGIQLPLLKRESMRVGLGAAGLFVVYGIGAVLAEPLSRFAHLLIK